MPETGSVAKSSNVKDTDLVRKLGAFTRQTDQSTLTKVLGDPLASALEAIGLAGLGSGEGQAEQDGVSGSVTISILFC